MLRAIAEQLVETGQEVNENPVVVAKTVLDSLAFRYASILKIVENLTGQKIKGVQIVGGGGRNNYLNQMTAGASGLDVVAGLTEATVTGNVLIQAIAAKRFPTLSEARKHVAENIRLKKFAPQSSANLKQAAERYSEIEANFLSKQAVN